ncbi:hypothetical protein CLAFUW4_13796 [Fulvia fulva]|uniref:Uncharacterized protein n=1 Tax=Passalora fulva TaxID=5499 RepID=A0A9Q8PKE5_PASFU|nr:uncharacterized protein CLAFUR5_13642 [Fulvia fulva]KAK4610517.1 hypothetical protein CLAFUR4_13799 [Fulvia fulva]KAK4610910.1 hypothetical protein CLAFUR0_13803 [Fulvia fulva]UJO24269.1 hypothetical protein CLAFUR5_13642 [Fulvia fulva]WPV22075.1 hypothetical protein CLAFUW4_13796 [Fulvia fulva]WPV37225.1 hypothetical protein CLAFUW7_13804 [Fulvia fulva]
MYSQRDWFSRLPAELCNAIHELVFSAEHSGQPLNMSMKLPTIINVSGQTLRESFPMWLAKNDFIVHVQRTNSTKDPRTDIGYRKVLEWLDWLSPACVRFIGPLTIILEDRAYVECENGQRHPDWDFKDIWVIFVAELAGRGLLPRQLQWPSLSEQQLADLIDFWRMGLNFEYRDIACEQADFQQSVLTTLLESSELMDPGNHPINIYEQAAQRFDRVAPAPFVGSYIRSADQTRPESRHYCKLLSDVYRPCVRGLSCSCSSHHLCCSRRKYCIPREQN